MGVKEFLRPDRKKILITLLLFGISIFLTFLVYVFDDIIMIDNIIFSLLSVPFFFVIILASNLLILFTLIILILAYTFSCYITRNEKWFKGIILYLVAFLIVSVATFFVVEGYNVLFGHSCDSDEDCYYNYDVYDTVNRRYIPLTMPYGDQPSVYSYPGIVEICENNRCISSNISDVTSVEDCERRDGHVREGCYHDLAQRLNDPNLCDKITDQYFKRECVTPIAQKLADPNICNKIEDEIEKEWCLIKFVTSVEDCEKMKYSNSKSFCYYEFAKKLDSPELCNKIENQLMVECKIQYGILSIEDCEKAHPLGVTYCYSHLAQKLNDPGLCDRLKENRRKEECRAQFK